MSTAKKLTAAPDGPDEVEAVKGEVLDEAKMVDWHGTALTLPAQLPASMFFDMTESEIKGDNQAGNQAVHTVYKLLGPDQWHKARDIADEHQLSVDDFGKFIDLCFSKYGMGSGESSEPSVG